jgi:hypothetical protein
VRNWTPKYTKYELPKAVGRAQYSGNLCFEDPQCHHVSHCLRDTDETNELYCVELGMSCDV